MNDADPTLSPAARRQAVARAVQRRLLAHIANGRSTDFAPAPMRIAASVYADPLRLEAERRELFLKLPLVAGLSADLANPGDIKVFDGAGPSIIVTRGGDGEVAAFRNMCPHRGSRLVDRSGNSPRITCPFHGWSFSHDGRLVGQPGKAGFEGIDRQRLNLLRVPSAERYGLLFVKVEVLAGEIDVDAFLGSLGPEMEQLDLGSLALVKRGKLFARANWKHVLDTYGEGYHFAKLHPDTLGTTHYTNVMAYDAFDPHWRVAYAPKTTARLAEMPESEWPALDAVVYYVFPNTAIVAGSPQPGLDVVQLFTIFPQGVGATQVDLELYAPATAVTEATRPTFEAGYELAARIVETQDYTISAGATDNLRWAPPDFAITLGRNEIALQNMERRIAETVGLPLE